MTDYMQKTFDEAFDTVYINLIHRKKNDSEFTKQSLKELLESLYVHQGNNWVGRSQTKELTNNATVAACEAVLSEWE